MSQYTELTLTSNLCYLCSLPNIRGASHLITSKVLVLFKENNPYKFLFFALSV